MARNYAALKHDYLLEMEELTDAEFGRALPGVAEIQHRRHGEPNEGQ